MNKLILLTALLFQLSVFSQTSISYLEFNNVNAIVSTGGTFFTNPGTFNAGYEFPKGSGNHLIYANSFWFGGKDINDNIKLSGQQYDFGQDLFPGPLSTDGLAEVNAQTALLFDQIFTVTKAEIDDHIQNFSNSGYIAPASITDWPAHGDVSLNQDFYLAPFIDVNQDDFYSPEYGDYPLIRGDIASYVVMNDKLSAHSESGGDAIGIECHFMFYQYASTDHLNNTTFVNIKLINRGTQTIYDFSVGGMMDTDLGDATDDYMGSDSLLNLIYSYNALNTDADYGTNPPAVGLVSLNNNLSVAGSFISSTGPTSAPNTASEYILNMTGNYKDGSQMTEGGTGYGGTVANSFQYHGDPNTTSEWSEIDEGNLPGDRKLFYATEAFTLTPNEEVCYDFAIVVGTGGDHLENVTNLKNATTFVQDFFDTQDFVCENVDFILSNKKIEDDDLTIFPQPSISGFKVSAQSQFDYEIYSIDGKIVEMGQNVAPNDILGERLTSGQYVLHLLVAESRITKKIIVK